MLIGGGNSDKVDVVSTDFIILEKGYKLKTNLCQIKSNENVLLSSSEVIYKMDDPVVWNKIFRKEIIDKYSIRFITDCIGEDYLFLLYFYNYSNNFLFLKNNYGYTLNRQYDSITTPTLKSTLDSIKSDYLTLKAHKDLDIHISLKNRIQSNIDKIAIVTNIEDKKFLLKELYDFEKYIDFNESLDVSWQNILNKLILRRHFTFVSICLYIIGKIRLNKYLWGLISSIRTRNNVIKI